MPSSILNSYTPQQSAPSISVNTLLPGCTSAKNLTSQAHLYQDLLSYLIPISIPNHLNLTTHAHAQI